MNHIAKVFSFLILSSLSCFAQQSEQTLLHIGKQSFSKSEFEYAYKKNNSEISNKADLKSPEEYLDMYINFKLKVIEAQQMGMDTLKSFRDELDGYRTELSKSYLTDMNFDDHMIENAYYRSTHERKASHILVQVPAEGNDTTSAYSKIMDIRTKIMNGADFNEMAFQYSEDPSAKTNKGELGYFSAFQMVFPFEDMAYKTPIGQVSIPVRTRFGYHLIKVEDERPSKGQMRVAHIMLRLTDDYGHEMGNPEKTKAKTDSIYQLLQNGADFNEMVRSFSQDKYSARNGGELPPFTESRMIPEFAAAAFALKNDGDISTPVKTMYGWHIIKRLEHITVPELEKMRPQIVENIRKNPTTNQHSKDAFIQKLKNEYHFTLNQDKANQLKQSATQDTTTTLFSFASENFSIADLLGYLRSEKQTTRSIGETQINDFAGYTITKYENDHLEQKYPEFKNLMQEYHDGILLFNISEKMVWNKASEDTTGLKTFYESHKQDHLWDERFKGWIIKCKDFETRSKTDLILSEGKISKKEELLDMMNQIEPHSVEITEGTFAKGDNPIVDFYVWNEAKPAGMDDKTTYLRGDKIKPEPKTLDEARGLFISDYQDFLEKQWISQLRKKYPVKVNKSVLKTISSLK